jgi:dihydromethanopterin reductase (acceptor)
MKADAHPRLAWAITGSGHYLKESLELARRYPDVDLFLSSAGEEILNMYDFKLSDLKNEFKVFRDNTASAAPVGLFYHGHYHGVVIAPATSNTVAKCALGISDTLPTNVFAQAGKCRLPSIVFACDTAPEVETESPSDWVTTYPRAIDLHYSKQLAGFERVTIAESIEALDQALQAHYQTLAHFQGQAVR